MLEQRLRDLEENIVRDQQLLKACEEELSYTRDPIDRARYLRDIDRLKQSVAQHQQEYNQLKQQSTGLQPAQMQQVSEQLSSMTVKLDDLFSQIKPIDDLNIEIPKEEALPTPSPPKTGKPHADYSQLRQLLEKNQWREADQETIRVILEVAKRESWLRTEDLEQFPCFDLRIIDKLWLNYSKNRFGFSVQQKIWQQVGGNPGTFDGGIFHKFGDRVAWHKDKKWLDYHEFTFSLDAPEGHFPSLRLSDVKKGRYGVWMGTFRGFLSRIATCLSD